MTLSIITINKNNAAGLEKTCLSVITQTFKDFEWIIIDGASDDNSVDIIKKYSSDVTYWISEPDTGVYNAMNKGIKKAEGDYFLFLNSGDYLLHPWTLEEVFKEIKILNYADVYYSNAVLNTWKLTIFPDNITLNYLIDSWLSHQNCLINKNLFNNQLYDENFKIISDWYFFLKAALNNNIIFIHIKTNISIYDMSGISTDKNMNYTERYKALRELNITFKKEKKNILFYIKKLIKYILPYGIYKLYQHIRRT